MFPSLAQLFPTAVLFVLFTNIVSPQPLTPPPGYHCRCHPSQPCWPNESTWSALNETVGGRLIVTTPVARECHDPYYDKARCDEIKAGYFNATWRQNQPGAVEVTNWETLNGQGCLGFNRSQPCLQGSVPLYSVKALTTADVQASVRFAAKHNIRLAIKNTGHCFLGRSTAADSLNIWIHPMNKISVVDSFVPEGAPDGTPGTHAAVMEGGVLLKDLYQAVHEHGRVAVGGAFGSVSSIGGYCQGGGHSPISRYHGLCVDNVLQYKVVTADGELRVANAYQNQDLFWALRGGGGGTFGVVVEGVIRTHPGYQNLNHASIIVRSTTEATMGKIVRRMYADNIRFSEDGWSGYNMVERQMVNINYYLPNATLEEAKASLAPFLNYVHSLPDVTVEEEIVENFPSFLAASPHFEDQITVGGTAIYLGSRLIPYELFQTEENVERLASTLESIQTDVAPFNPNGTYLAALVAGREVTKGTSEETSVTPAWRKALMLVILFEFWSDDTPLQEQVRAQTMMTTANARLISLTPGGGTYFNEADANEPNWQYSFFGDNYPKLREIKDKFDPHGLFVCRLCVGSEDWDQAMVCPN
ncbi:hypothetical protein BGW41_006294 [Actinomortierella wolfii]|nr:hypothetical protein BGW41_006294 [Actinomortierella wolfii]